MELEIGTIVEGKVKTLTKFGAFVVLPDKSTGMVHISEVAHTFVNDISEHLHEGDDVKVMIIGKENGKISLSIKRTVPRPQSDRPSRPRSSFEQRPNNRFSDPRSGGENRRSFSNAAPAPAAPQQKSFDDMLKQFMTESDSKMSSLKQYSDYKPRPRRR